jgi:P-aminobenzoate N-oxygenase AurF
MTARDGRLAIGAAPTGLRPSEDYRSRFRAWDEKAWVRSKPHQVAPFQPELYFFAPELSPLFVTEAVRRASEGARRHLLTLLLYDWLEFTEWLEVGPVNRVCDLLRQPHFLPWLPAEMKADALKIYTDEAGHAEMAHALSRQVEQYTGVVSARVRPAFLAVFDRMVEVDDPSLALLTEVFLCITSETLITGTLKRLPNDTQVQEAVRDIARDHAQDEARHHAYFRQLCAVLWRRLPQDIRRRIGAMLPEMVLAFLQPYPAGLRRVLESVPELATAKEAIVSEACAHPDTAVGIREMSRPTLRVFAEAGVFADNETAAAFFDYGLDPLEPWSHP